MVLLGSDKFKRTLLHEYIRPQPGDRILDVGCGTGTILEFLPRDIAYLGLDLSPEYIAAAERKFGDRARFRVGDVNELQFHSEDRFQVITAVGLLHHLNDDEVGHLVKSVRALLSANGRFVTVDNCFTDNQSPAARALIRRDRGRNVRSPGQYQALIERGFDKVACEIRHDLLRIPYTHVIFEASLS